MTERAISLCVINHNGLRHLEHSLGAARQSRLRFGEVLLIDNGSTDGSRALVEHCYPEVRVIALGRNGGPGTARNSGFEAARHDLILFVDNDVAIASDCASLLDAALVSRPGALAAMPRVLYADRRDIIQYDGADCHFLGHMILRHSGLPVSKASSSPADAGSLVTACFMVDRAVWGTDPPFDPSFIFNNEDHDFGIRSKVLGHTLLVVPSATCLHGSGTPGLSFRPGGQQADLRVYCLIRNRWRIILQCYSLRTLLLLSPALMLFELFQLLGAIRKGWVRIWLRALGWVLTHGRHTVARRREVQRARRTGDRAILRDGNIPFTPDLARGPVERAAYHILNRLTRGYWHLVEARL
jgi:GT2 family glycosyltransferase